mmetsp:Transcript_31273/g.49005  ORF Transcript_31273/g.49005 Transcript_31273/m.49005 type:complete len:105 (-) Transcript_31273:724-1038(-)
MQSSLSLGFGIWGLGSLAKHLRARLGAEHFGGTEDGEGAEGGGGAGGEPKRDKGAVGADGGGPIWAKQLERLGFFCFFFSPSIRPEGREAGSKQSITELSMTIA